MQAASVAQQQLPLSATLSGTTPAAQETEPINKGTVLGDLKLTEHLSNELETLRSKFDSLNEALEKVTLERDSFKVKFTRLNSKQLDQKKEIE